MFSSKDDLFAEIMRYRQAMHILQKSTSSTGSCTETWPLSSIGLFMCHGVTCCCLRSLGCVVSFSHRILRLPLYNL
jgi:hypothetical protein